jgi:(p)ppGpp synthase/HD superfamily hydrolase
MNLEKAIKIAVEAHTGQLDKGGNPYILHPLRVMLSLCLTSAPLGQI